MITPGTLWHMIVGRDMRDQISRAAESTAKRYHLKEALAMVDEVKAHRGPEQLIVPPWIYELATDKTATTRTFIDNSTTPRRFKTKPEVRLHP